MEKGLSCRLVAVSLLVSAVGGCNAKLTVDRYPDFYDPELKSVAVVPFANLTQEPQAGTFLAERLAEALRANGTYQAVGPAELNSMLAKVNLALPVLILKRLVCQFLVWFYSGIRHLDVALPDIMQHFPGDNGNPPRLCIHC